MSLTEVPELAAYRDEPKQLPSGTPGKHGALTMKFVCQGERSVLADLVRKAPLLVQQALYFDEYLPGLPCVFIVTTTGCVVQGDRFDISIDVGAGAMAHVTTQAATKIHRMEANFAAQSQRLNLAENAYLEFLPGPTIPHKHSRFITQTIATVDTSATLLFAELVQPGRKHHGAGELFEYDLYSSSVAVTRPDGTLLCSEKMVCDPLRVTVRSAGVMGKFDVLGSVTLATAPHHAEALLGKVSTGFDPDGGCLAGASRLPHDAGLSYKVLGMETEPVSAKVREFWNLVRHEVTGAPIPAPRSWR